MPVSHKRKPKKPKRREPHSAVPPSLPGYLRRPRIPPVSKMPAGYSDRDGGGSFQRYHAALCAWLVDVYGIHPTRVVGRARRVLDELDLMPARWLLVAHQGGQDGVPLP